MAAGGSDWAQKAAVIQPLATASRLLSSGPRVGDLPRSRSVQQEQLAEGSDYESTAATGRPAAWPARSPDAPPDPATRTGGRETMPDERAAEEAARMTIRHGSGKSAEAIMAGPEAAEAHHSNTAVKFVYQQQPSPYSQDVGVGTTTAAAAEQVARQDAQVAGSGTKGAWGGPTDDVPELGGVQGVFGPKGEMGADHGLRTPRQARSRGAPAEAGGGSRSQAELSGRGGGGGAASDGDQGGGGHAGWQHNIVGNGIGESVKAGVGRLQEAYETMFGSHHATPVQADHSPDGDRDPQRHGKGGHRDGVNNP
ncbi:hypothetical protein GPECTOR_7g1038 [Gonium pectorale]|uniref:Uncharacterized protein n=1 Tax=Gonium pectorale TaxID=33097 RepID=A0A150GTE7_GONPE|nr:hypothetical protein GPECTOR_7g1038 [Gonium pectorale]|eukprot:KXZ53146.1 hypothetical protein GPECTOR_7g1038 [Gonium pectorale]